MKTRWKLFTYPLMDIKAAEAMLNRQAAEGWRLEKVHLGALASFVPAETPVCYCIDWYDPNREDGLDYRRLLTDAGWHPVGQLSYWNLYEAPAGTLPIQTGGELEYQRFRKKALRRMTTGWSILLAMVLLLVVLAPVTAWLGLSSVWQYWLELPAQYNTVALLLLFLPLLLLGACCGRRGWCCGWASGSGPLPLTNPSRCPAGPAPWRPGCWCSRGIFCWCSVCPASCWMPQQARWAAPG
ncbi:hypothetical protein B5G34_01000 [Flavonifractor sp. An82]|uniref:DUF2812 domain-containing protein n=1 Tax=Flavonifractor sp. An82 TaxID=1965660 RepID=UPI000B38B060|nr:DUF2812 domain-containing protein [Flavonifractor sp. An82]OUN23698.1 hypothetical protein B5G34_01000 [Flavonifractor sp. An82]